MNLFDPSRPKLANGLPTWTHRNIAISHFELRPLPSGNLEISIWLPLKDETFATMRFTKELEPVALHGLIQNFTNDPEATCEFLFLSEPESPELRRYVSNIFDTEENREIRRLNKKKSVVLENISF